jgi:hypothetical protein
VNVWIPLTPVGGTNSLWLESVPGKQDFQPLEVDEFGTAVLFWGNQCEHYSVANDTNTTRLSLDLRVVRSDLFVQEYIAPANTKKFGKDARPCFLLGSGYTSTSLEKKWLTSEKEKEGGGGL